ncbi:MAG: glycine zipper domain-containing protein [Gemmataceae bacterium]
MKRSFIAPRSFLLWGMCVWTLIAAGCSHTEQGVVGGGAFGALLGALIGGPRHAGAGAAIGAVTGMAAGGAMGASEDRRERREAAAIAAMRQPPLSTEEVIRLTATGVSDDVIVNQIRASGSVYHLSADDLVRLTSSGVREPVIREMQATASRPVRRVYTAVPVQPVYVVEPPPPPPPIGFGVTYIRAR